MNNISDKIIEMSFPKLIVVAIIITVIIVIIAKLAQKAKRAKAIASLNASYAKTPYLAETDLVKELGYQTNAGDESLFPSASQPAEEISLKTYQDPEEKLADYRTFDFDYTNKDNPLLEKELFLQLEKILARYGLTRVKKNPQAVISMNFFIGKKEQYTPPTTVISTETQYVWNTGFIGWNMGGFTSAIPITKSTTTPGYTTISYYTNIRINILNHAKLSSGKKPETPPLVWLGEADSEGPNSDIRFIALIMFEALASHLSNQPLAVSKFLVCRFRYGGLGLGFDPNDWRIIRYIEPSSIADDNNLKPGDILIKINDNSPSRAFTASKDQNPYFLHVLSNPGKSDVKLLIKSGATGKKISLSLKPRLENRYVRVDDK